LQQISANTGRSSRKPMPLKASKVRHHQIEEAAKQQLSDVVVPPLRVVHSNEPAISPRILQALKEDSDASESLSDIRGLLLGPVTRLHEARIEELLSIVDEADRGNRQAVKDLNVRADDIVAMCEKNQSSIAQTNENLRSTAAQQDTDLVNAIQHFNDALKEMFQRNEANFQQHSNVLNDRVATLAARTADDNQAMLTYLTKRIDELEATTAANAERNFLTLESQFAKYAADLKLERTNDFESISEGFADFSDRMLGLRVRKTVST
jgi:oligoribonuclease (3'-5' exoribonuclease)